MRYSEIDAYYKCPTFYENRYVLNLAADEKESSALKFGTAIHAAVEDLFNGGDGISMFEAMWAMDEGKDMEFYRTNWNELLEDGQRLIANFKKYHLKHFVPKFIERQVECVSGVKLSGTIDFVGEYKGIPSIIDFKTSSRPYNKDKLETNEQLYIYNHMARVVLGYEASQHVYVVFQKRLYGKPASIQVITRNVAAKDVETALLNVTKVVKMIETGVYIKNRNSCFFGEYRCGYYSKCYGGKNE